MFSTVARRAAFTSGRRFMTTAAGTTPNSMHTRITFGASKVKSSNPALAFYTARLGRTLSLVVPGAALLSWPFVTRKLSYWMVRATRRGLPVSMKGKTGASSSGEELSTGKNGNMSDADREMMMRMERDGFPFLFMAMYYGFGLDFWFPFWILFV